MSTTDSPARADPAEHGRDWAYGTQIEQPLDGAPGAMETPPQHDEDPDTAEADAPRARDGNTDRRSDRKDDRAEGKPPEARRSGDGRDDRESRKDDGKRDDEPDDKPAEDKQGKGNKQGEAEQKDEPPPPPPSKWVFIVTGLIIVGLLAWGAYAHWRENGNAAATQQATADAVPQVRTTEAKRDDKPIDLTLPGQTEALDTANLYPRATGYVSERRVDIGSRVNKGELLLHIQAPDIDQQLAQAEAQVGQVQAAQVQAQAQVTQAEANLNLAKVTLARTATLTQQGYETLQNRDNQTANLEAQQANVDTAKAGVAVAAANTKAQLATVDRLKALTGFEDVIAPFDGVVTVRNVDVGDLVNADASSSTPLFSMARDAIIRVTVQVPQNAAVGVRNGLASKVEVSQLPGRIFRGTVTRSSVALLSSARTLDTEVDIPNPDGVLRPGLFAYVTIDIPRDHPNVMVPAEALIFNQYGLEVATVDNDKVTMHSVKIYRDLGTTVELSEGLNGGEQVILSPPALLQPGQKVKVQPPEKPADGSGDQKTGGDGKAAPAGKDPQQQG